MRITSDFVIENRVVSVYHGPGGDVVIPDGTTAIGSSAFKDCKNVRSITIPNSVWKIGEAAFCGCEGLADENGFVIVKGTLFSYHGKGGDITVPSGVAKIEASVFEDIKNLRSITIPDGVTEIGAGAFKDCKSLVSIALPNGITEIREHTFENCKSLEHVILPDSVRKFGDQAFEGCQSLRSITNLDSVTEFGYRAFGGCKVLADDNGFFIIRDMLFSYRGQGGDITIPEGVSIIGGGAFEYRRNIYSVTIPEGVTEIESGAFWCCKSVRRISNISGSIKEFGEYAFSGCDLQVLTMPSLSKYDLENRKLMPAATMGFLLNRELFTDAQVISIYEKYALSQKKRIIPEIFNGDLAGALVFYAEHGKITVKNLEEEYLIPAQNAKATECIAYLLDWKNKNVTPEQAEKEFERVMNKDPFNVADMKKLWKYEKKEDGTIVLKQSRQKYKIAELTIPERIGKNPVTEIGALAFYWDDTLRSIIIPDGVTKIGESAFTLCFNLSRVTIPGSVSEIADTAFDYGPHATIYAPAGSYAEKYAKENKIRFKAI